jgi:hypothetical protein
MKRHRTIHQSPNNLDYLGLIGETPINRPLHIKNTI